MSTACSNIQLLPQQIRLIQQGSIVLVILLLRLFLLLSDSNRINKPLTFISIFIIFFIFLYLIPSSPSSSTSTTTTTIHLHLSLCMYQTRIRNTATMFIKSFVSCQKQTTARSTSSSYSTSNMVLGHTGHT